MKKQTILLLLTFVISLTASSLIAKSKHDSKLFEAVDKGSAKMVYKYVEKGANVNTLDYMENTPLILAIIHDEMKVAKALVDSRGNYRSLVSLISFGVDINSQSDDGTIALMCAAYNGHENIVRVLFSNGAKDIANLKGNDALTWAKKKGHSSVVQLLESYKV